MKISIAIVVLLELILAGAAQNKGGVVTGQIRTPEGAPAVGVRVAAMADGSAAAAGTLFAITQTDARGTYSLEDIPNGRYHIVAGPIEAPFYHPGIEGPAGATIVTIANTPVNGVDFSVALARVMTPRFQSRSVVIDGPAIARTLEELCDRSTLIVDAYVEAVFPATEISAGNLETDSLFRVDRVLKGANPGPRLVVHQRGGTLLGRTQKPSQYSLVEPKQHYILFLLDNGTFPRPDRSGAPRYLLNSIWGLLRLDSGQAQWNAGLPKDWLDKYNAMSAATAIEQIQEAINSRRFP